MGNLTKKAILNYAVLLAKYNFPGLVSNVASNSALNSINKIERREYVKRSCKSRKIINFIYLK